MSGRTSVLTGAIDAIHSMQEAKGSSLKAIQDFMKTYPLVGVPSSIQSRSLIKVLDSAVQHSILGYENGRYKICCQSLLRKLRKDDGAKPDIMAAVKCGKKRRRPRSCGKKRKRSCGKKRRRRRSCGKKRKRSCGKKRHRRRSCGKKRKRSCGKKRHRRRSCGKKRKRSGCRKSRRRSRRGRKRSCGRKRKRSRKSKRSCGRKRKRSRKSKRSCGRKRKRSRSCRPKRCKIPDPEDVLVKRVKRKTNAEPKSKPKRSSPVPRRQRPRKEDNNREGDSQPTNNPQQTNDSAVKHAKVKRRRAPIAPEDLQNVPCEDVKYEVQPVVSHHSNLSILSQPEGEDSQQ